jgi:LysM repeat protein
MTFFRRMIRLRFAKRIAAALILCASLSYSHAADKKSQVTESDLAAIRQSIEDQTKQLQLLTEQVAHLTLLLETHGIPVTGTPSPAPQHAPATAESSTEPTPDTTQSATETPGTHVVTKGETLTSIAKHYKITVGDLEKVNKIENDRTLQIGQTLIIPTVTPSPTPQEKKENQ